MNKKPLLATWSALAEKTLGPTDWFEIDQLQIDAFADITLDHQVIHIDPTAEATKALGGTIAHGFLGLSMLSHLSRDLIAPYVNEKVVLNYGLNKVRFITPIPASSKVRLTITIRKTEPRPQGVLVTYESVVEIHNLQKPAFFAEQLILILE